MAGMGPPPKAPGTRARRNAAPATTTLSTTAREGKETPAWPLRPDVVMQVKSRLAHGSAELKRAEIEACDDARSLKKLQRELERAILDGTVLDAQIAQMEAVELELWTELWMTPQASMWEQLGWAREVAQYVRWKVRGEMGDLDAAKEARQWSDRLGLNPLALLRLRWEIERADEAQERGAQRRQRMASKKTAASDPRRALRAV